MADKLVFAFGDGKAEGDPTRRDLLGGYRYPTWLLVVGVLAWLLTLYLGYNALLLLGDL